MARKETRRDSTVQLVTAMRTGSNRSRRQVMRALCPCRNTVRDLAVWREMFRKAVVGGRGERHEAAHAIATLLEKAPNNPEWRELLVALEDDLDRVMQDTRVSREILGEMGKRGKPIQTYRRRRKALNLATPVELANWVNEHLDLPKREQVTGGHHGVRNLWRWMKHRVESQPNRSTREEELVEKARRYLPGLFQGN